MTKISGKLATLLIPCVAIIISCSNNKTTEENSKAILDTVSLSNKNFALAYQDENKIVATSIDTMKQISFGGATNPAISPDGNKLAYTVTDSAGHRSVWVADMENKSQLQLLANSGNYYQAMWSPSGNVLAFSIFSAKNIWKIGVVKPDNTGLTVLDSASKINVFSPTWKNEQELIGHDLANLYTFDISGKLKNSQPIAALIGNDFAIASSNRFFYTSDGKGLVFNANNKTGEAVYILDLASKKVDRISPEGMNVPYIFVTADDRIFYSGAEKSSNNKIYVSDLDGNSKLLVNKGTYPTGALK
ncbi:TolB family protein [Pedobacter sp.]|uniref:TolB family protein n=1 Tax=Pedobacter sp. TaxID=1411316 RepID=UPI003BAD7C24